MFKNVAGQKVAIYAFDTVAAVGKSGDAGNITARISKDGGASAATNDVNPTELDAVNMPGLYVFDMTQAETNADLVVVHPLSGSSSIQIEPAIIYTVTP